MFRTAKYLDRPTRRRFLLLLAGGAVCAAVPRTLAQTTQLGIDRDGRAVHSLAGPDTRFAALLFIASDCPFSNRYLPEILRLAQRFHPQGARFWLVYPNPADDVAAVRAHQTSFPGTAALDTLIAPDPRLLRQSGVHVTPEAALFRAPFIAGQPALWHGRIDDRYLSIGTQRSAPTRHDLADALAAALKGEVPAPATGHAVGCAIIPRSTASLSSIGRAAACRLQTRV